MNTLTARFVNKESRAVYGRRMGDTGWQLWLRKPGGAFEYVGFQYATLEHLVQDIPGSVECYGNILFIDTEQTS